MKKAPRRMVDSQRGRSGGVRMTCAKRECIPTLKRQENHAAIQAGIDDMEAGRVMPLEAADRQIREELGFGPPT